MAALRWRLPQIVSEVVRSAENVSRVVLMEGSRRSRVKGSSLLQDRRSTSSAGCSVQRVLAVLRDFSTTDFEGSGLGMQQAKHIPPHTQQGCHRTTREAIASSWPDSG